MTDEQRADSMGCSHTPHLGRIASSGVRFSVAYTLSPVCVSARACMLTRRTGSSIGVLNNHHVLDLGDPRLLTWQLAVQATRCRSTRTRRAHVLTKGVSSGILTPITREESSDGVSQVLGWL